jgi:hypothetical protein
MTGDDRANRNPVEWRTDRTDGIAHVFDRMAAAAAVLDEHRSTLIREDAVAVRKAGSGCRFRLRNKIDPRQQQAFGSPTAVS